jgi:hypothetical protein
MLFGKAAKKVGSEVARSPRRQAGPQGDTTITIGPKACTPDRHACKSRQPSSLLSRQMLGLPEQERTPPGRGSWFPGSILGTS